MDEELENVTEPGQRQTMGTCDPGDKIKEYQCNICLDVFKCPKSLK